MFHKISVLVPTRKRLTPLAEMITSFYRTAGQEKNAELVFRVDADDDETLEFLLRNVPQRHVVVVGPRLEGYRSLPLFFNEMLKHATGDIFLCGNDDIVFRTSGWVSLVLQAAEQYPDGVFDFGVLTHNETHFPLSIVSRKVTDCLGFIFDPRIFWGDIFLRDVMAEFGRAIVLPNVQIDHNWMGHAPDTTFLEGEHTRRSNWLDAAHATAVREAVEKIRGELWLASAFQY
jgi:glycosyltransferase involved in cell wall biosynthesis